MMTETIALRDKPELKIVVNTDRLEIIDASDPRNNGICLFEEIKSATLNAEKTDVKVTFLSHILGLLFDGSLGEKYTNKANLTLELNDRMLTIRLTDADFKKAERLTQLINHKMVVNNG